MADPAPTVLTRWLRQSRHAGIALAAYLLVATAYTWPLLGQARTRIANDPFDPILNTSILWWNATVVPFTTAWWTPPFFYPSQNIAAFTENLAGISVVASPIYWMTGEPILTYNLVFFLTWPLSAMGAYLLAWFLVRRHDAAFIAGLAFGFAPYRLTQLGHIQVLSIYWLPFALLGLHGYLADRRRRWLALFGAAWVLQSLANGYFMFFGGVVIALWIAYFCSARIHRRALVPILATWLAASLPLAAVMLKYRAVHEHYGLSRGPDAAIAFGAQSRGWIGVIDLNWFWSRWFPDAGAELDVFPGATALAVVALAAGAFFLSRVRPSSTASTGRRALRLTLGVIAAVGALATVVTYAMGPWNQHVLGIHIKMSGIERAAPLAIVAGALFVWLTPAITRRLRARSVFAFYGAATAIVAILACGPEIRHGSQILLSSAPYRWLMILPGLDGLRVTSRFWMVGALCLAMAAAAAFAWLVPRKGLVRAGALGVVCFGLMLDAWPRIMPMAPTPDAWPLVEPAGDPAALIELPLGPLWDAAATFRAVGHRRPVVNGVSGYDPPHYALLQEGLEARDPGVLLALATFGPLDVIVSGDHDPGGSLTRYVEGIAGVSLIDKDGPRTRYRLPQTPLPTFGPALTIHDVTASANSDRGSLALDGDVTTAWLDGPQDPDQWFRIDLGSAQTIGGVELSMGRDRQAFPRRLAIDVSTDAVSWRVVWDRSPLDAVVGGAALDPQDVRIDVPFDPVQARFVRLRQLGRFAGPWAIAEVRVFAPR